jgi:Amt family ammonium transporter
MSATAEQIQQAVESFFLLFNAVAVFLMSCGYTLIESGGVRSQNAGHSLFKTLLILITSALAYWITGYAFAFGGSSNAILGTRFWASERFGARDLYPNVENYTNSNNVYKLNNQDPYINFFYNYMLTFLVTNIAASAFAERCRVPAYILFSIVMSGFVYPFLAHWMWGTNGWLGSIVGARDYGGSAIIYLTAGVAALIGTIFLGPRYGRFEPRTLPLFGHSIPVTSVGAILVTFGFFVLNSGADHRITGTAYGDRVGHGLINTLLSAATSGATYYLLQRLIESIKQPARHLKRRVFLSTVNSIIAGMVAVAGGAVAYNPWSAIVIGFIAAISFLIWSKLLTKLHVDDPVETAAVHIGGGLWGIFAVPIFRRTIGPNPDGNVFVEDTFFSIIYRISVGESWRGLLNSLCTAAVVIAWTAIFIALLFLVLKLIRLLKVSREEELRGIDLFQHGEPAYALRIYCAACGEQLQGKTIEQETVGVRPNFPTIVTDAEGAIVPIEYFSERNGFNGNTNGTKIKSINEENRV